ncbi:MAG TPA: ribosome small subunit-dependent GTPase A [Anaeromyxobacter sp.]
MASPGSSLDALGYGPFFSCQVTAAEARSLLPGRAVEDRGRRLAVSFQDGERLVTVPGRLRARGEVPVVGDFVLAPPGEEPPVARVLARRTVLSRGAAGRAAAEQALAANVDVVCLVHGLDAGVKPRRIERTLAAVYACGAEPVVVLAKADLDDDLEGALAEASAAAPASPVLAVSARTGEGIEAVRALLAPGRTGVFVGPSGSGKSTLVNALLGEEVQPTAAVRARDARGRHTTAGRRLLRVPRGGAVIDGPGIRELKLWDAAGIGEAFEDVSAIAGGCRFGDCAHEDEPGCAVRAAVEEGKLDPVRLESLRKLEAEARAARLRRGGAEARAEKQRWRAVARDIRRFYRDRGRE